VASIADGATHARPLTSTLSTHFCRELLMRSMVRNAANVVAILFGLTAAAAAGVLLVAAIR